MEKHTISENVACVRDVEVVYIYCYNVFYVFFVFLNVILFINFIFTATIDSVWGAVKVNNVLSTLYIYLPEVKKI